MLSYKNENNQNEFVNFIYVFTAWFLELFFIPYEIPTQLPPLWKYNVDGQSRVQRWTVNSAIVNSMRWQQSWYRRIDYG